MAVSTGETATGEVFHGGLLVLYFRCTANTLGKSAFDALKSDKKFNVNTVF